MLCSNNFHLVMGSYNEVTDACNFTIIYIKLFQNVMITLLYYFYYQRFAMANL